MKKVLSLIFVAILMASCGEESSQKTETKKVATVNRGKEIDSKELSFRTGVINSDPEVEVVYLKKNNKLFTGVCVEKYSNGAVQSKICYKDGITDGPYEEYYENGKIESVNLYKKGVLNGKAVYYYENGNKKMEMNYKNGLLDGKYVTYYENGVKSMEANYQNDLLNGEYKEYSKDGKVIVNKKMEKGFEK